MSLAENLDSRDLLICEYQNYARAISFKIINQFKIPKEFFSDLIAAAHLGLVEAANKFDPSYGVDFKVYAYYRIRGEAIDFLRKNSNLSSVEYKKLKAFKELDQLAQSSFHQQTALAEEIDKNTDSQVAKLFNLLLDGAIIYQLQRAKTPAKLFLENFSAEIAEGEISERIISLMQVLNEREYKIIYDYYFLDKSFMEISTELNNFSKSWMSRIHHQALTKMRNAYLNNKKDV